MRAKREAPIREAATAPHVEPPLVWQPSLFDDPPARAQVASATSASATRRSLDAHSWIEVYSHWIASPEVLLHDLLADPTWRQRERWMFDKWVTEPRLTAEYRDFSAMPYPAIAEAADALSSLYGVRFDGVWMNLYRDGHDSTAWHRDRFACRRPECTVPVLTLGATRKFLLRRRKGGSSFPFHPASGTLVVMGGRCQEDWVHSVPKQPTVAGVRVSVNFQSTEQAGAHVTD
jgi:alkylated DNA repair dioxygenase AlkB